MKKTIIIILSALVAVSSLIGGGMIIASIQDRDEPHTQGNVADVENANTGTSLEREPGITTPEVTEPGIIEPDPPVSLQKPVSDDGYGRMEFTAGGLSFRVGDTVQTFVHSGFQIDEAVLNTVLEPWGFMEIEAKYDAGRSYMSEMEIHVLNESDDEQCVKDCRTISVIARYGVSCNNLLKVDSSTKEDILASFDPDEQMIDTRYIYSTAAEIDSDTAVGYGNSFNCIRCAFSRENEFLEGVEIRYLENIFQEIEYSSVESLSPSAPILAASLLSKYFETESYLETWRQERDLADVLKTYTLSLTLENVDFHIGESDTFEALAAQGLTVALDDEEMVLRPNNSKTFINPYDEIKILGKNIQSISFRNYMDAEMELKDTWIQKITIFNNRCISSGDTAAAEFDLYGLTADATIQDILTVLGEPLYIDRSAISPHLVELEYKLCGWQDVIVTITVDPINNSIYEVYITAR